MSVFGFIENFFFISLGIVFGLILLLVYHFKNRMAIAEKKSESMYGLLSAVVKEIKSLRGMFGLGGESAKSPNSTSEPIVASSMEQTYKIQPKSDPEIVVPVNLVERETIVPVNLVERETIVPVTPVERETIVPVTPVERETIVPVNLVEREVITLDLNASEPATPPKIVVSDVESESDTESDLEESFDLNDSSDDEEEDFSDEEDEDEDEEEDQVQNDCPLEELNVEDLDVESPTNIEPIANIEEVDLSEVQEVTNTNVEPEPEPVESANDDLPIPSNDQLRKMNINQLKTIAIQLGITADTSKMKKPELIGLIQAK